MAAACQIPGTDGNGKEVKRFSGNVKHDGQCAEKKECKRNGHIVPVAKKRDSALVYSQNPIYS